MMDCKHQLLAKNQMLRNLLQTPILQIKTVNLEVFSQIKENPKILMKSRNYGQWKTMMTPSLRMTQRTNFLTL